MAIPDTSRANIEATAQALINLGHQPVAELLQQLALDLDRIKSRADTQWLDYKILVKENDKLLKQKREAESQLHIASRQELANARRHDEQVQELKRWILSLELEIVELKKVLSERKSVVQSAKDFFSRRGDL